MSIKGTIFKLLNSRGHVYARWPLPGTFEYELRSVLVKRKISVVLDVGAHEGNYGLLLRQLGFGGEIHSFEPNPHAFSLLSTRADLPRWKVYKVALGDNSGQQNLTVYRSDQLASLHSPTQWGESEWNFDQPESFPVDVQTLAGFIEGLPTKLDLSRTLLKIDTQGHDAAVLAGGGDALASIAALQIEMAMVSIYEDVPRFTDLLDATLNMGFRLVGIAPVQREVAEKLVPIEFDALFVRSDLPVGR